MSRQMSIFLRTKTLIKTLNQPIKSITTTTLLRQQPVLVTAVPSDDPPPLPPSTIPNSNVIPLSYFPSSFPSYRLKSAPQDLDVTAMQNKFADWMTSNNWAEITQLFETWVQSTDQNGKRNKPDVNLYNHYLRANLQLDASSGHLLDLVERMQEFSLLPNTASFNLVLKAMRKDRSTVAAEKLLLQMELMGKESRPDDESYDVVIMMLLEANQFDTALKYVDKTLKCGNILSSAAFPACVKGCLNKGRLDALASIIGKCKAMDQNKALWPSWDVCNFMAEIALKEDNSKLANYALEFMHKWIVRGENVSPSVVLSVDEGLAVSALGTAGRTYSSTLLNTSWTVLNRSLRQKKTPNPETYIAKIYALSSLGNLDDALDTLHAFEATYGNSDPELFSPFTALHPLVVAFSKKGYETLDSVYFQLASRAERQQKSLAAINCIILGCANIWDLERANDTFNAIDSFGLTADIHSFNALMCAFGRLKKTVEAKKVFEALVNSGIKHNAMSYSLLADAHLMKRDAKAAVSVMNEMVSAGFVPSKELLKKVKRRCIREMDYESDDAVESLARKFNILLNENRRNMLFSIDYSTGFA